MELFYDNDWNILKDTAHVSFYRLINYVNSKPIGKVTDYYVTGKKQMEADSLKQENPAIYHGNLFFYSESGRIQSVEFYDNGIMDTTKTIKAFESLIKKYQKEIPNDLDLAQTANELAYVYRVQKNYSLAEKYYIMSMDIRENKLGKDHLLYANSCSKLAWVYLRQGEYEIAEPLFLNSLIIYGRQLGKKNERYTVVRDHLITIYKDTNQMDKLNYLDK